MKPGTWASPLNTEQINTPEMGSERIGQEAGPCPRYLEATKEVLNEGPSVGADRHIAVELSEARLRDLSPIFTDVLLPQVELQRGAGDKVKWLQSLGRLVPRQGRREPRRGTWEERSAHWAVPWSCRVTALTPPRMMFLAISTPRPRRPDTSTLEVWSRFIASWPNTYLSG